MASKTIEERLAIVASGRHLDIADIVCADALKEIKRLKSIRALPETASGEFVVVPRILTDAMKETAAHIADGPWISAQEHWDAMLNAASRNGDGK